MKDIALGLDDGAQGLDRDFRCTRLAPEDLYWVALGEELHNEASPRTADNRIITDRSPFPRWQWTFNPEQSRLHVAPAGFAGCPNFPNDPVPGTAHVGCAEDVAVRIERRIAENVQSVGSAREIVQVDVVVGAPRAL